MEERLADVRAAIGDLGAAMQQVAQRRALAEGREGELRRVLASRKHAKVCWSACWARRLLLFCATLLMPAPQSGWVCQVHRML